MFTHRRVAALLPLLALGVLALLTGAFDAPLGIPFSYAGDELFHLGWIQTLEETGSWRVAPRLAAPFGQDLADFPTPGLAPLTWVGIRVLLPLTGEPVAAMNLWYLAGFPLAALGALAFLATLGVRPLWAGVGALLYAFLPYPLLRGTSHLLHSQALTLPLMGIACVHLFEDRELPGSRVGGLGLLVGAGALLAGSGGYWAAFSAWFVILAGLAGAARSRRARPLLRGGILALAILGTTALLLGPRRHRAEADGPNPLALRRLPLESELYALRLMDLVLPHGGHRVEGLRTLRERYSLGPLDTEGARAGLGTLGALSFLGLLALCLAAPVRRSGRAPDVLDLLAVLTVSGFLLGTLGGIGSAIAFFASPALRAYARVALPLGLFTVAAATLVLDRATRGRPRPRAALALVVLTLGLLDQVPARALERSAEVRERFAADRAQLSALEAALGEGAAVLQLPHRPFPEVPARAAMGPYDELRPYLHTTRLRLSAGSVKGRPEESLVGALADLPVVDLAALLPRAGFDAVLVDRAGYADQGARVLRALRRALGPPVREGARWVAYEARPAPATRQGLRGVQLRFGAGFWPRGYQDHGDSRWSQDPRVPARLHLANTSATSRTVRLRLPVRSESEGRWSLRVEAEGPSFGEGLAVLQGAGPHLLGRRERPVEVTVEVPPGIHTLALRSDAPARWAGNPDDPRPRGFRLRGPRVRPAGTPVRAEALGLADAVF